MATIVIPKQNTDEKLMAVPRRQYEEFLTWQKKIKSAKVFKPTANDIKVLKQAKQDFKAGRYENF